MRRKFSAICIVYSCLYHCCCGEIQALERKISQASWGKEPGGRINLQRNEGYHQIQRWSNAPVPRKNGTLQRFQQNKAALLDFAQQHISLNCPYKEQPAAQEMCRTCAGHKMYSSTAVPAEHQSYHQRPPTLISWCRSMHPTPMSFTSRLVLW